MHLLILVLSSLLFSVERSIIPAALASLYGGGDSVDLTSTPATDY